MNLMIKLTEEQLAMVRLAVLDQASRLEREAVQLVEEGIGYDEEGRDQVNEILGRAQAHGELWTDLVRQERSLTSSTTDRHEVPPIEGSDEEQKAYLGGYLAALNWAEKLVIEKGRKLPLVLDRIRSMQELTRASIDLRLPLEGD